jgi:phosphopantetheinyl transferase (holo-ACP synthase)
MLTVRPIRYSVAIATPRDTESVVVGASAPRMGTPAPLDVPETSDWIRTSVIWNEPARHDWLASRLAAKRAASGLLKGSEIREHDIDIVRDARDSRWGTRVVARHVGGRTRTRQLTRPLSLSISLSHANGRAIAAATHHPARIGVDLEREGRVAGDHADYFLAPRERRQQHALSLTGLWALKESAWKALGCGDSTPFAELELLFDAAGCVRAVRLGTLVTPAIAEVRRPWPGWVAAVVVLNGVIE